MAEGICKHCHKPFTFERGNKQYCSKECRIAFNRKVEEEKRKAKVDEDNHWLIDKGTADICLNCKKPAKKCYGVCKEAKAGAAQARRARWRDEVKHCHELGMNDSQIAEQMGVSVATVGTLRRELGLPAIGKSGLSKLRGA